MALVDYSDSEISEEDSIIKVTPHPPKDAFKKVVDRSNPGKIRVSLPRAASIGDIDRDEPPTKRTKRGGGGLSDFNSFLPPPKRESIASTVLLGSSNEIRKSGLVAGVSLKTGSEPGFTRELELNTDFQSNTEEHETWDQLGNGTGRLNQPRLRSNESAQKPAEEVTLLGKPLTFKPLSVTRKSAKKSKQTGFPLSTNSVTSTNSITSKTARASPLPKVSLFSISAEPSDSIELESDGNYQPLVYGASVEGEKNAQHRDEGKYSNDAAAKQAQYTAPAVPHTSQSLSGIASDLNLSEAERRRLFGRQKGSKNDATLSAAKIINFNTDQEYRHNEELRAAGEQVVHNPVRSIAPGKHSLRQLVNAAANQKEALEESFAKGKNNRTEAGSRYGW